VRKDLGMIVMMMGEARKLKLKKTLLANCTKHASSFSFEISELI